MSPPVSGAEKLKMFYGRHRGIEDVSFAVEPGEVFGFLGDGADGKPGAAARLS